MGGDHALQAHTPHSGRHLEPNVSDEDEGWLGEDGGGPAGAAPQPWRVLWLEQGEETQDENGRPRCLHKKHS